MSFILTSDTLNLFKVDYTEGRVESFKVSWNNNRTAKQGALRLELNGNFHHSLHGRVVWTEMSRELGKATGVWW